MRRIEMTKTKLLVVEDDPHGLFVIETMLVENNYDVCSAVDGERARRLLENPPAGINAILLDWRLPKISGIELLRWIKQQPAISAIPVIMVTGMVEKDNIREGIDAGAFYYLTKPYDSKLLISVVQAAVRDFQFKQSLLERLRESENPLKTLVEGEFRFKNLEDGERLVLWMANACPHPERVTEISEFVINAVEHGNLGITYEEKTRLIASGLWQEEIERRLRLSEHSDKYVRVHMKKNSNAITVLIEDQGNGFDFEKFGRIDELRVFDNHGRGIAIATAALDVRFLEKGNKVLVTIPL
jgi:DNA-binding response OmpR family regulator